MKNITIAGRTGKDAVLRNAGDNPVLSFTVAVDDGYGENKRTMWFDCSLWGKRGASLESHLRKGTALTATGDLSTREHEGKTYLTLRVSELTLQGGKSEDSGQRQSGNSYDSASGGESRGGGRDDLSDDVPF